MTNAGAVRRYRKIVSRRSHGGWAFSTFPETIRATLRTNRRASLTSRDEVDDAPPCRPCEPVAIRDESYLKTTPGALRKRANGLRPPRR